METNHITRPLPYISDHAAYLLEVIKALHQVKKKFAAVHLAVSQRKGEQADDAWLHFYHEQQSYDKLNNPNHTSEGDEFLQVHSATRRIENQLFIKELEERIDITYPFPGIQLQEDYDHVRYKTFSDGFDYDELVVVLDAMAQEQFTEEVAVPVRPYANIADLRQELLNLLGISKTALKGKRFEDCELYLSADLNEDESNVENEHFAYHNFTLIVGNSYIRVDEDVYGKLVGCAAFNGEYYGDNFYNIMLSETLACLV